MEEKNSLEIMIERQALESRRAMIHSGQLIDEGEFRRRLGRRAKGLGRLKATGSVFEIEVEGTSYFPALLANEKLNLQRLYAICRLIVPAPPMSRYHYLVSRRDNLGGIAPISCLDDDQRYRVLREMARGFASEYSRTIVSIYSGNHVDEPIEEQPVYRSVTEIDPRTRLWKRCLAAICIGGFECPTPPYPPPLAITTAFVCESPAGGADRLEARLNIAIDDGIASVTILRIGSSEAERRPIPLGDVKDIKALMQIIFTTLKHVA